MKLKTLLTALTSSMILMVCADANAKSLENVFNELNGSATYGAPTAIQTQTMNYYHGGNLSLVTPSRSYNLASVQAPSVNAGCGGIDLHMGGFSFISKEQFVQAMRNIGSNALGYGFKIALQNICPTCENVMTSLQNIADRVNQFNINSCQAAKGIVHAAANEVFNTQYDTKVMEWGMVDGIYRDGTDAYRSVKNIMSKDGRKRATERVKNNNPERAEELPTGNITWSSLNKIAGLTEYEKRMFMGVIGTVVYGDEGIIVPYHPVNDNLTRQMISSDIPIMMPLPVCIDNYVDCLKMNWANQQQSPSFKMIVKEKMEFMSDKISKRQPYGARQNEIIAFANSTEIPVYKIVALGSSLNNKSLAWLMIDKYSGLIAARYAQAYVSMIGKTARKALENEIYKGSYSDKVDKMKDLVERIDRMERSLAMDMELLYNSAQTSHAIAQEVKMLENSMISNMSSSIANSLAFGNNLR